MSKEEKYQQHRATIHIPMYKELMALRPVIQSSEGSCLPQEDELIIPKGVNISFDLLEFYTYCSYWSMKWSNWREGTSNCLEGSFKFQPFDTIISGDVGLDAKDFPIMKNFTILDSYLDENAVGFYLDAPEKGLFYYEMDASPKALLLDFKGYIDMLKYTRGFLHWQLHALNLSNGGTIEDKDKFDKLNALFPNLTIKGFTELYKSLIMDKK